MNEKMVAFFAQMIGPKVAPILTEAVKVTMIKANETAENSKEQTRLLMDILEELKQLRIEVKKC